MSTPEAFSLTDQENALAVSMRGHVGSIAMHYIRLPEGRSSVYMPRLEEPEFARLAESYQAGPKELLAHARQSLLAIGHDRNLNEPNRLNKLSSYLDDYATLIAKLDHRAFPPDSMVRRNVPDYVPDGLVDMGSSLTPSARREHILVDKVAVMAKHKPALMAIFSADYSNLARQWSEKPTREDKKKAMVHSLAKYVHDNVPYDHKHTLHSGGTERLSEITNTVCRHQNLVFQVLAQAAGVETRMVKADLNGQRHAAGLLRIARQWYLVDVTNPDVATESNGQKTWQPAMFPVDGPPEPGQHKQYIVTLNNGQKRTYNTHVTMHWKTENYPAEGPLSF